MKKLLLLPAAASVPTSGQYALGSPLVQGAVLHLENGQQFTIQVKNQSAKNVYVQQVTLNGQKLTQPFLAQQDVAKSGVLVFMMGLGLQRFGRQSLLSQVRSHLRGKAFVNRPETD